MRARHQGGAPSGLRAGAPPALAEAAHPRARHHHRRSLKSVEGSTTVFRGATSSADFGGVWEDDRYYPLDIAYFIPRTYRKRLESRSPWIRVYRLVGIVPPIGRGYVGIALRADQQVGRGYVCISQPLAPRVALETTRNVCVHGNDETSRRAQSCRECVRLESCSSRRHRAPLSWPSRPLSARRWSDLGTPSDCGSG